MRGSFHNANTLTLFKLPNLTEHQPMITFVLDNGSVMLWWTQCGELNTSGVLRFISTLKKITTIKLLNNSGSELTELEVDTIATIISENVQLENLWLGSQSLKIIHDFVALAKENDIIKISENDIVNFSENEMSSTNYQSVNQQKLLTLLPTKKMFKDKLLLVILHAFQNMGNVKRLDLSGNVLTEESAQKLAFVLVSSTELETLLLKGCSLGNKGVTVIANSLKKCEYIEKS